MWVCELFLLYFFLFFLLSTYDALHDMQSPIETCKAPQNNNLSQ